VAAVSIGTLIIILLIVLLVVALPTWPYSRPLGWGYYPTGALGLVLIVIVVLILLGRL